MNIGRSQQTFLKITTIYVCKDYTVKVKKFGSDFFENTWICFLNPSILQSYTTEQMPCQTGLFACLRCKHSAQEVFKFSFRYWVICEECNWTRKWNIDQSYLTSTFYVFRLWLPNTSSQTFGILSYSLQTWQTFVRLDS